MIPDPPTTETPLVNGGPGGPARDDSHEPSRAGHPHKSLVPGPEGDFRQDSFPGPVADAKVVGHPEPGDQDT